MLTFRQIDDLPEAVIDIMAQTEQTILEDMARRIAKLGEVTEATLYQADRLQIIGSAHDHIVNKLSKALDKSADELVRMFDEAAARTLASDDAIYKAVGYSPIPLAENPVMQQIIWAGLEKTMGEFINLTLTTAQTATLQFERALDLAYNQIIFGGMDYKTAIKNGIKILTRKGLAVIVYPSGHVDYLDVAFRRAAMTGPSQSAGLLQIQRAKEMGQDFMELTAHAGARPDHAVWQGRIVSLSGQSGYLSLADIGYGDVRGFKGANCRHDWYPYFEGSSPAYSKEQLDYYNNRTVTYNGKKMSLYDATQKQRYFERQIRRWKREASALDAAGLDNAAARRKVQEWQATQRDFIDQTDLRRDYFRERAGKQLVA